MNARLNARFRKRRKNWKLCNTRASLGAVRCTRARCERFPLLGRTALRTRVVPNDRLQKRAKRRPAGVRATLSRGFPGKMSHFVNVVAGARQLIFTKQTQYG